MAHTILGIDLGSYSIKLAQLEAGFRTLRLLSLHERELAPPLPPAPPGAGAGAGDAPESTAETDTLKGQKLRTLKGMIDELQLRPEMTATALDEAVTLRVLTLPLSDPKKVEQVLPYELEGQLLSDVEEQIVDYTMAQTGLAQEDGRPGQGSRVVAAAAPRTEVQALLEALEPLGLEPRLIGVSALSCAALFSRAATEVPAAVLDLGHEATQLCVVRRDPRLGVVATFARTIGRGGRQLTLSLGRALQVDEETAKGLKHAADLGALSFGADADGPRMARVSAVLREALRPLLRDLRQTLASYVALYGEAPGRLLLTGGGSRLRGLLPLLQEELELPVEPLGLLDESLIKGSGESAGGGVEGVESGALGPQLATCASALGLALAVAAPAPQVNFRKGDLSYRTDYSFLREKAPHLVAAGIAVLFCAGLSALASLRGLQRESDQLATLLRNETTALFGEARVDGRAVSAELSAVLNSGRGGGQSVPTTSAFDLLDEISRAAPPGGSLDINDLNIRPKKTDLKGTAATAQFVDDLQAALGKIPCFKKEMERGPLVKVRNTGPDGKPVEATQFTLTLTTTCL